MQTLRLSKPLFKSELHKIYNPNETREILSFVWEQVKVKVDKDKLGNSTCFTYPCVHREPQLNRDNLSLKVGSYGLVLDGVFQGTEVIVAAKAYLKNYLNKPGFQHADLIDTLLDRLMKFVSRT